MAAELTLGPVLFNWKPEEWRDFYYKMADESPVADVYLGEVVCSKRQPFFEAHIPDVVERLERAKKKVIFSSLALVMSRRESQLTRETCGMTESMVEANDISAVSLLKGRPHAIGPFINLYNEATLEKLADDGAVRFCLPQELPSGAVKTLAQTAKKRKLETEVQVFGRVPLALSGRCYHARLHKLSKDSCLFVCANDADGLPLRTIDGKDFLAINGIQTMSHAYLDLMAEMKEMAKAGVTRFRLSPHSQDMVAVSKLFHTVLKGKMSAAEGQERLKELLPGVSFSNGFYHSLPGHEWQAA